MNSEISPIMLKTLPELFFSGGYIAEGKIARAASLSLQSEFPQYLTLRYRGRFFGYASLEFERAFQEGFDAELIDESYFVRPREPVHLVRGLSQTGDSLVRSLLDNLERRKEINLPERLVEFAGEVLSVTLLPAKLAVAFSLYLTHIDQRMSKAGNVVESEAPPITLYHEVNVQSIEALRDLYANNYSSIVQLGRIEPIGGEYVRMPVRLVREGVRRRYKHLDLQANDPDILKWKEILDVEESHANELVSGLAKEGIHESVGLIRADRLRALQERFGGTALSEEFITRTKNKIEILARNQDAIAKVMNHIYQVLEAVAEYSSDNYEVRGKRLEIEFFSDAGVTFSRTLVPEDLKDKIRRMIEPEHVWHFGINYHIEHAHQVLERLYLLDNGQVSEVLQSTELAG